jgi:hypothetical protein
LIGWYAKCMTDDQMIRAAIVGAAAPIQIWLMRKLRDKLRADFERRGHSLLAHICIRLGFLLGTGVRAAKNVLH